MQLDPRFLIHNTHLEQAEQFESLDPNLRALRKLKYIYSFPLLQKLPVTAGIYTISGGRQIGKSTLMKQWMQKLLLEKVSPESILFLTGEIIDDHHSLIRIIQQYLLHISTSALKFIIVDEITYIKDWDKGIKFLADSGMFENAVVVLTGSDLLMIQEARMRFPGRRGKEDKIDFHLHPLSFRELVNLQYRDINEKEDIEQLFTAFYNYLIHGGYLTAINDYADNGIISKATIRTYSDWVRGDAIKRGKSEYYLREFLQVIIKTYGTQVTWNSLSQHISIDHPKTIQEYSNLLEAMDVLFVQHAIIEDKLIAAPKKAKKIYFTDPFIYHAILDWLNLPKFNIEAVIPALVETAVLSTISRHYDSYYIKSEGEVDIAYVKDNKFWPIEIKWTNQTRPKDLKQIQKYNNAIILSKNTKEFMINGTPSIPLPLFLYQFENFIY